MVTMKPNQKVGLSLKATGNRGGDLSSQLQNPLWSADAGLFALMPGANELAIQALAQGVEGSGTVTVSALKPNGEVVAASVTIEVRAELPPEEIETVEIVVGEVTDQ